MSSFRRIGGVAILACVATVSLVGCGPIFGAIFGGVVAADELSKDKNTAPSVVIGSISARPGPVTIAVTVTDDNNDTVAVDVAFDTGTGFLPATVLDNTVANTKSGASASITWDAQTDVGAAYREGVKLRLTPRDGKAAGREAISGSFAVGNDPPIVTAVAVDSDPVSGFTVLRFTVSDSAADDVSVSAFELSLKGDFTDAQAIALTSGAAGHFPSGSLTALPTSTGGTAHSVTWNTKKSLDGDFSGVAVRLKVSDGMATSAFSASAPFAVDNNESPTASIVNLTGFYAGIVPVQFTVADAESDAVNVLLEFSIDGKQTWLPITRAGGGPISGLAAGVVHSVEWDTLADGVVDQSVVHVRVSPFDPYQAGLPTESVKFSVANGIRITPDLWLSQSPMPTGRSNLAVAEANGKILAVGGIGFGSTFATAELYDVATDTWSAVTDMPTARSQMAAAAVDGKIYVMGGVVTANGMTNSTGIVECYDPATNAWTTKAAMPTPRAGFGIAVADDKIFAIGGVEIVAGAGTIRNTVEIFDPAANSWTAGVALPTARVNLAAAAVNGRIFTMGGTVGPNLADHRNTLEIFDTATNAWRSTNNATAAFDAALPAMPTVRQRLAAVAVNGRIYAIGGVESVIFSRVEAFDPASETWHTHAAMPDAKHSHAATESAGKIFVLGGSTAVNSQLGTVEAFDPTTDVWRSANSMTTARAQLAAATVGGMAYAIGGAQFASPSNTLIAVTEAFDPGTGNWTTKAPMPTPRQQLGAAVVAGKIYAIGGADAASPTNRIDAVEEYDPGTDSWAAKTAMLTARAGMSVAAVDGKIFAIGGTTQAAAVATVEMFDPAAGASGTWSVKTSMPTARSFAATAVANGKIYVIGGTVDGGATAMSTLEIYDPVADSWATGRAMPTARAAACAAVVDGKILVAGGLQTPNTLAHVEIYDPAADSWRRIPSLNVARLAAAAVSIDGQMIVMGGSNADGHLPVVEIYRAVPRHSLLDLQKAPFPATPAISREFAAVAATETTTWVIGGFDAAGNGQADVFAYRYLDGTLSAANALAENSPYRGDTWALNDAGTATALAPLPTARGGLSAVVLGGKIYAIGGLPTKNSTTATGNADVFDPTAGTWSSATAMGSPRAHFGCVAVGGKIYVFGGTTGVSTVVISEFYDPGTNAWTLRANMPTPRSRFGCVAMGTRVICAGGILSNGTRTAIVEIYDTETNSWTTGTALPSAMSDAALVAAGGLYLLGGFDGTNGSARVYRYDFDRAMWLRMPDLAGPQWGVEAASIGGTRGALFGGRDANGVRDAHQSFIAR